MAAIRRKTSPIGPRYATPCAHSVRRSLRQKLFWRNSDSLTTAADLECIAEINALPGRTPGLRGVGATLYPGRPRMIRRCAPYTDKFRRRPDEALQGLGVSSNIAPP